MLNVNKMFLIIILIGILASCASSPRFTSKESSRNAGKNVEKTKTRYSKDKDTKKDNVDVHYNLSGSLETATGYASYYANDFDGRQTANGETFNMYELTAAHKTYSFNTMIRVTNLSNNKTVIVRINDRGPFVDNRIIDLSLGAAMQLDMVDSGVQEVQLDIIEWGN